MNKNLRSSRISRRLYKLAIDYRGQPYAIELVFSKSDAGAVSYIWRDDEMPSVSAIAFHVCRLAALDADNFVGQIGLNDQVVGAFNQALIEYPWKLYDDKNRLVAEKA